MSNVLFCVAHCDDEVLMCGGTIAKHVADGDTVHVMFFSEGVSSRTGATQEDEMARMDMARDAMLALGYKEFVFLGWKDQQLDTYPQLDLNKEIEKVVTEFKPDIVYTHWDQDNNLDHRLVSQACMVACRSVGEIRMGKPNGEWIHRPFEILIPSKPYYGMLHHDISEFIDKKQAALDCYKEELGEMVADPIEQFIVTEWVP